MTAINAQPRRLMFPLGKVVATPGALQVLERCGDSPARFLVRHAVGDWGDISIEDEQLNDEAVSCEGDLAHQSRVLSVYTTTDNQRIWIITEADRSSTCLLLPSEY